ncbi:MAG: PPC domain-containing protein, partial [Pseudomonadota bacterium]
GGLGANATLHLYDQSGNLINSGSSSGASTIMITRALTANTLYYLGVEHGGTGTNYSLNVNAQPVPSVAGDRINGTLITGGDASNSASGANAIVIEASGRGVATGAVGFGTDGEDFYSFTPLTSGNATFSVTGLSADIDLLFYSGNNFLGGSFSSGNSDEQFTRTVVAGDTYTIRLHPYLTAETTYNLAITSVAGNVTGANDEIAGNPVSGNDAASTAAANAPVVRLASDTRITGSVGFNGDTADYYLVTPTINGQMRLNLSGLSQNLDLRVFSTNGTTLLAQANTTGAQDENLNIAVTNGTGLYVAVVPNGSATSNYQLDITPVQTGSADRIGSTTVTNNDAANARASATNFTLPTNGNQTITGSVGFGSDTNDYYSFTALASGAATFTLQNLQDDLDIQLYSGSGRLLQSVWRAGTADEVINFNLTNNETYVLRVFGFQQASTNYTLSLVTPQRVVIVDDYNSTTTTTGSVTVGGNAVGNIERAGDIDWFGFTAQANHQYRIDLEGSPTRAGTNPDVSLMGIYNST